MGPDQRLGRPLHMFHIQRMVHPHRPFPPDRGAGRSIEDPVPIVAPARTEAGMKFLRDLLNPVDRHVCRQVDIGPQDPGACRSDGMSLEMHHLTGGMHPGVRTSGTVHGHRMIGHLRQGLFETLLHAAHITLILPAMKIGTVVFDA